MTTHRQEPSTAKAVCSGRGEHQIRVSANPLYQINLGYLGAGPLPEVPILVHGTPTVGHASFCTRRPFLESSYQMMLGTKNSRRCHSNLKKKERKFLNCPSLAILGISLGEVGLLASLLKLELATWSWDVQL